MEGNGKKIIVVRDHNTFYPKYNWLYPGNVINIENSAGLPKTSKEEVEKTMTMTIKI